MSYGFSLSSAGPQWKLDWRLWRLSGWGVRDSVEDCEVGGGLVSCVEGDAQPLFETGS